VARSVVSEAESCIERVATQTSLSHSNLPSGHGFRAQKTYGVTRARRARTATGAVAPVNERWETAACDSQSHPASKRAAHSQKPTTESPRGE